MGASLSVGVSGFVVIWAGTLVACLGLGPVAAIGAVLFWWLMPDGPARTG